VPTSRATLTEIYVRDDKGNVYGRVDVSRDPAFNPNTTAAEYPGSSANGNRRRRAASARGARSGPGDARALDALPKAEGGTDFQRRVWAALRRIPAGTAWSYGDLARQVGRPAAVRAVGQANGANPVALVQPCHRVIASGGGLGGYAGGLERKAWLLRHEGVNLHS
jgi:O-6-methylguanine DNA methyltransferase